MPSPELREHHAIVEAREELRKATARFGPFRSAHEGISVLREEFDELWEAVRMKQDDPDRAAAMRKEGVQVAAMALRFLIDCCDQEQPDGLLRGEILARLKPTPPQTSEEFAAKVNAKATASPEDADQGAPTHLCAGEDLHEGAGACCWPNGEVFATTTPDRGLPVLAMARKGDDLAIIEVESEGGTRCIVPMWDLHLAGSPLKRGQYVGVDEDGRPSARMPGHKRVHYCASDAPQGALMVFVSNHRSFSRAKMVAHTSIDSKTEEVLHGDS